MSFLTFSDAIHNSDEDLAFPYTSSRMKREDDMIQCEKYPYGIRSNVKYRKNTFYTVDGQNTTELSKNNTTLNMIQAHNETDASRANNETNTAEVIRPLVESHHTTQTVGSFWNKRDVPLHVAYIQDPLRTVSVYEPLHNGTCEKGRWRLTSVLETARNNRCLLAVNAGFFNTSSGECYGTVRLSF